MKNWIPASRSGMTRKRVLAYQNGKGNKNRYRILTFHGAFHGRTFLSCATNDRQKFSELLNPYIDWCDNIEPNIESVKKAISNGMVHALGQVAHFDMERKFELYRVRDAINYHIKSIPIVVLDAEIVDDAFHERFSAKKKTL